MASFQPASNIASVESYGLIGSDKVEGTPVFGADGQ
jgi:hypothetical protein